MLRGLLAAAHIQQQLLPATVKMVEAVRGCHPNRQGGLALPFRVPHRSRKHAADGTQLAGSPL